MTIEARLSKLEKTNRRLTAALVAIVAISGVAIFGGADDSKADKEVGPFKKVSASSFELVSSNGELMGHFGITDSGSPVLWIQQKDRVRASMMATSESAGFRCEALGRSYGELNAKGNGCEINLFKNDNQSSVRANDKLAYFACVTKTGMVSVASHSEQRPMISIEKGQETIWRAPPK